MSRHGDPMVLIPSYSFWRDGCAKVARQLGESLKVRGRVARRFPAGFQFVSTAWERPIHGRHLTFTWKVERQASRRKTRGTQIGPLAGKGGADESAANQPGCLSDGPR